MSPSPFGSQYTNGRVQMLFLASELLALPAGGPAGGLARNWTITAIAFPMVFATPDALTLSVFVALTSQMSLKGFNTSYDDRRTSFSIVPDSTLNRIQFSQPLVYDGSSNMLIDVCHSHTTKNYDRCGLCSLLCIRH
jgi:hypothetical protein